MDTWKKISFFSDREYCAKMQAARRDRRMAVKVMQSIFIAIEKRGVATSAYDPTFAGGIAKRSQSNRQRQQHPS
jgi:hypothetical protein